MKDVNVWDFVEKYYPNYYHCDTIAECDDLYKILNNEINGVAEDIYDEIMADLRILWDGELDKQELKAKAMEIVKIRYNEIHVYVYEKSIEEFLKQQL